MTTYEILNNYISKLEDKIQQHIKNELELKIKIIDLEFKLKAIAIEQGKTKYVPECFG